MFVKERNLLEAQNVIASCRQKIVRALAWWQDACIDLWQIKWNAVIPSALQRSSKTFHPDCFVMFCGLQYSFFLRERSSAWKEKAFKKLVLCGWRLCLRLACHSIATIRDQSSSQYLGGPIAVTRYPCVPDRSHSAGGQLNALQASNTVLAWLAHFSTKLQCLS